MMSIEQFPVPSIVHLRSQHFSAIVGYEDGRYRVRDPGLGGEFWLTAEALRDESSGFALAASRPAGAEWRAGGDGEGQSAVGHCTPGKPTSDDPPPNEPACGPPGPGSPPADQSRGGRRRNPPANPNPGGGDGDDPAESGGCLTYRNSCRILGNLVD